MALKGTLKDFGIADILQLIGQQQKTGVLVLKSKEQDVRITFREGAIVHTESATRRKKDLIGAMLVRAEMLTEAQLNAALEEQKRTLRRLGDVLVKNNLITEARFKEMMQLQATETLYQLFMWKSGAYHFDPSEVELDKQGITPLRAESVLMEGFRMVDEWPQIKKKIARYDLTFERLKSPPATEQEEEDPNVFDGLDDAFSEEKPLERKGDFASLGRSERRVFDLVSPGRTVRKLIDLSCLGEFETCKALLNLVNLDYLKAVDAGGRNDQIIDRESWLDRIQGLAGRVLAAAVLVVTLGFAAATASWDSLSISGATRGAVAESAMLKMISRGQLERIQAALDVYQLEKGEVPEHLDVLVNSGLLTSDDLRYPWRDAFYYRRLAPREFILLPPLR